MRVRTKVASHIAETHRAECVHFQQTIEQQKGLKLNLISVIILKILKTAIESSSIDLNCAWLTNPCGKHWEEACLCTIVTHFDRLHALMMQIYGDKSDLSGLIVFKFE